MGNFLSYSNQLRAFVPILTPQQAEDFINRAWQNIKQAYDGWTFLAGEEYWLAPGSITLGDLVTTQFSDSVGLSWDSIGSLAGLNNPPLTQRQLRFGTNGGPVYVIESTDLLQVTDGGLTAADTTLTSASAPFSAGDVGKKVRVAGAGVAGANLDTTIASYTSPTEVEVTLAASTTVVDATVSWGSTLTLARPFNEGSDADAAATCVRFYYSPLSTDFARIDHLTDPTTGYEFGWDIESADGLDRMDPQRASQGNPWKLAFRFYDPDTFLPVYELWPVPNAARAYKVTYWKKGEDFVNDADALPPQIPEELLLMQARILAYEFAMTADNDDRRRGSYGNALSYIRGMYYGESQPGRPLGKLDEIIRQDKNRAVTLGRVRPRFPGPGWPIDSNFAQRHAIPGWY